MSCTFTTTLFPPHPESKHNSNVPWGCVIQPLSPNDKVINTNIATSSVPRCNSCYSYINSLALFGRKEWKCCFCKKKNKITQIEYLSTETRSKQPSIMHDLIEYVYDNETSETGIVSNSSTAIDSGLAYIFLVDLCVSSQYLDLIKKSLSLMINLLSTTQPLAKVGFLLFSSSLFICDMKSTSFPIFRSIPFDFYSTSTPLVDILPLHHFLLPISQCYNIFSSTIEHLNVHELLDEKTDHALGPCLQSILNFLSSSISAQPARILTFINHIPNYGVGYLDLERQNMKDIDEILKPETDFYQNISNQAALLGISFDLFILSDLRFVGLNSLKYLCNVTGGYLMLYDTLDECNLPADLYQIFSFKQGYRGLLRIRSTNKFSFENIYGKCLLDPQYQNLFHLPICDENCLIYTDFCFTDSDGFQGVHRDPILQILFAYSFNQQRRLRILNIKYPVAVIYENLFFNLNPQLAIDLIFQQIIHHSSSTIEESRLILQHWFIEFIVSYCVYCADFTPDQISNLNDLFKRCENIKILPRLVFGLLKNPVLSLTNIHPDTRIYLQHFYSSIHYYYLSKAFYPILTKWTNLQEEEPLPLFLSKQCLSNFSESSPFYLLDTLHRLIIFSPFPLTEPIRLEDTIMQKANCLQNETFHHPPITITSEHSNDSTYFTSMLLDDEEKMGFSYIQFEKNIIEEVKVKLAQKIQELNSQKDVIK